MTSSYHFMGQVVDDRHWDDSHREIELVVTAGPNPSLKLTIYDMAATRPYTLNSQRFDIKACAVEEDLESQRDRASNDRVSFSGDVHVLGPLGQRGREVPITGAASWPPCFSTIRWGILGAHMAIAARPSPPYRGWVRAYSPPLTRSAAVNRLGRKLDAVRDRKSRAPRPFARYWCFSMRWPCPLSASFPPCHGVA